MPMNSPELPDSIGRLAHNLGANGGYPYASARGRNIQALSIFKLEGEIRGFSFINLASYNQRSDGSARIASQRQRQRIV